MSNPLNECGAANHLKVAPSNLLNEREAAKHLKVAPETLRTWRSRGYGPKFIRLGTGKGSSIRYDLAELETFIDAGRAG